MADSSFVNIIWSLSSDYWLGLPSCVLLPFSQFFIPALLHIFVILDFCTSSVPWRFNDYSNNKTKNGALRWKYQQQLGQERCSTDIIRKENFLGHTSTFYTMRRSELFRKFGVGWSSREMIAKTASGSSRAILEQASIIREDFRELQKW